MWLIVLASWSCNNCFWCTTVYLSRLRAVWYVLESINKNSTGRRGKRGNLFFGKKTNLPKLWAFSLYSNNKNRITFGIFSYTANIFCTVYTVLGYTHRRRINTEEKTKVVAAVWGTEFVQSLSTLIFCTKTIWRIGWIRPFLHIIFCNLSFSSYYPGAK